MKRVFLNIIIIAIFLSTANSKEKNTIIIATTIGPVDAGIIAVFESEFEKETGISVKHIAAGTGAALEKARKGGIDLVIVHAKSLEEKFVKEGYGIERIPLMYNDFVIVGHPGDPAGIRGIKDAAPAFKKIAEKKVLFISRGDKSGTHIAELNVWEKTGLKPGGDWYSIYEKGSEGNSSTLKYTSKMSAYTIIDRATYLSLKKEITLDILVEGDDILLNYITLIPVNPKKIKEINHKDAMTFVKWLTSLNKGQKIIKDFGVEKFGSPLFFPNSRQWQNKMK